MSAAFQVSDGFLVRFNILPQIFPLKLEVSRLRKDDSTETGITQQKPVSIVYVTVALLGSNDIR